MAMVIGMTFGTFALICAVLVVMHRLMHQPTRAEILAAMEQQQRAIDYLLADLCTRDPQFYPSRSLAWDGMVAGKLMMDRLKGKG